MKTKYMICKPCPREPELPEVIIDHAANRRCAKFGCGTILRSGNRGQLCEVCRRKVKGVDDFHEKAEVLPKTLNQRTFSVNCNGCGREISSLRSVYYGGLCGICDAERSRQARINRPHVDMDAAVRCYDGGEWSIAFVARNFGVTTLCLRNELISRGISIKGKGKARLLSQEKRVEIFHYLKTGATLRMAAKKYKISTTTVRHIRDHFSQKDGKSKII